MLGSTACGEGSIQQPMASVLVSRYAAIAALFHFNGFLISGAPKSEEPISLHDSLWFFNEDHELKPVMVPINGCGVAFSERRSPGYRLCRVVASEVTFHVSVNGFLQQMVLASCRRKFLAPLRA
jgi:hypothetical protein